MVYREARYPAIRTGDVLIGGCIRDHRRRFFARLNRRAIMTIQEVPIIAGAYVPSQHEGTRATIEVPLFV